MGFRTLARMDEVVLLNITLMQLEEQKLMHLLLQLRGALPEDCSAFVGENDELHERIRLFQAKYGKLFVAKAMFCISLS